MVFLTQLRSTTHHCGVELGPHIRATRPSHATQAVAELPHLATRQAKKGSVPVLRHLHREPAVRLNGGGWAWACFLRLVRLGAGFRPFRRTQRPRRRFRDENRRRQRRPGDAATHFGPKHGVRDISSDARARAGRRPLVYSVCRPRPRSRCLLACDCRARLDSMGAALGVLHWVDESRGAGLYKGWRWSARQQSPAAWIVGDAAPFEVRDGDVDQVREPLQRALGGGLAAGQRAQRRA